MKPLVLWWLTFQNAAKTSFQNNFSPCFLQNSKVKPQQNQFLHMHIWLLKQHIAI